jgi:putative transposase
MIKDKKGEAEMKKTLRKMTNKRNMNKRQKFAQQMLSHYSFRQHLLHKAEEYGCMVEVVNESYTSLTCTNCGFISNNYDYRIKECAKCKFRIDRDINGARNILIKNINSMIQ